MKRALSFFSALLVTSLSLPAGGVTSGSPERKVSSAYLLLEKSPSGKVLYNGEWYSENLLAKMMAPCGGTVGGTGMTDDFDGDTVCNNVDIDDDNDGVVDATESPDCFYTSSEMATAATVTTPLAIGSGDNVNTLKDGTLTGSFNFTAQALANATILEFTSPAPAIYSSIGIQMNATATSASNGFGATGATAKVQGFDGTNWVDISTTISIAGTTLGRITFPITNSNTAFSSYRIVGVGTANANTNPIGELILNAPTPYIESKYPKATCSVAADSDGSPNHQDVDSDGDGCSDSYEAGAIATETSNHQFNGTDANVDGLDDSVDTDQNSQPDYTSTYDYAKTSAINYCIDSDGDGAPDLEDIDDDNDGVLDVTESACTAPSTLPPALSRISGPTSAGTVIDANLIEVSENIEGFVLDFPYSFQKFNLIGYSIDPTDDFTIYVELDDGTTVGPLDGRLFFSPTDPSWNPRWTARGYPKGTGDINWVDHIVEKTGAPFNTTDVFYGPPDTDKAWGALEITVPQANAANGINKIIFPNSEADINAVAAFDIEPIGILSPCADVDFDGDGVPNRLDLDSDNDGCSDLAEAGVSPLTGITDPSSATNSEGVSYGIAASDLAGSQLNTAEGSDVNGDGLNDSVDADQDGTPDYVSTYKPNALGGNHVVCDDTDHDGVNDVVDIDDDNDGVLDATESPSCFYTSGELNNLVKISTGLPTSEVNSSPVLPDTDIPTMHDLTTTTITASNHSIAGNQLGSTSAVIYKLEYPGLVGLTQLVVNSGTSSWGSGAFAVLEGSLDDVTYEAVSAPLAIDASTSATKTWPVTLNQNKSYKYYRIRISTVGSTQPAFTSFEVTGTINTATYSQSSNPKAECTSDIDNDGVFNHHDLDSDGDGCPDTREAILFNNSSVTTMSGDVQNGSGGMITSTVTTSKATVPEPYGSNGFAVALQAGSNPDAYKYVYTYEFLATLAENNACTDNDDDGVADFALDLDSDDDGIPEAVESPSCFYTEAQAMDITEGVTSDFTWTATQPLSNTYDNNATTFGQVAPAMNILNKSLISFELPIIDRALLDNVKLTTGSIDFGGGMWRLEGLNVTTNVWEVLSGSQSMNAVNETFTFTNELQPNTAYHSYRIVGTSNNNVAVNARLAEFVIDYKNYNASLHRVKTGCNSDTDNDGVLNFFDRDSDGDGCPDAVEAGVSGTLIPGDFFNAGMNIHGERVVAAGPYGSNGLADGVETSPESAVLNYNSTYNVYAIDPTVNVCTDTDGDGKNDLTDIDDDNDGILDAVESPACFFTATEANAISKITSQFTSPDDDQADGNIQLLHDGATTLTFNFNAVVVGSNPTGSNLFTVEYPTPVSLATLVVSDNISATANANAVVVGSNDGITWSAALSPATVITTTPVSFTISATQPYKYYRIQTGSVPGALATTNTIGEITSTLATGYVASAHPKSTCAADADNDGIVNHHDLDSDGDGCADGMEGGTNDGTDTITSSDLVHSSLPGGNTGSSYTGSAGPVNYNLGNDEDANGVPMIVSGGQVLGSAQNAASQPANCVPVAPPVATADTVINNTPGTPASINVITNDTDGDPAIPSTVNLVTSGTGTCEDTDSDGDCDKLTVPGEGIWTVTPTGVVTFTPDSSFTLDPTPISYTVKDGDGETSSPAQITIDNVPVATNDTGRGTFGTAVTVPVVANDTTGDAVVPGSVQIAGTANPGDSLMVSGEGVWSVDLVSGAITFTPDSGFVADPTPITYTVQDATGNVSNSAEVVLKYYPLPVTLVSLVASKTSEGVLLKWRTTEETNFDRFEVEQSANPKNGFRKIGMVKGGGSDYKFLDLANHKGASYYRLKMVDTDGTYEYSRIVTVTDLNGQQLHRVYPNPSNVRSVSVVSVTAIESYAVYDASGQEMPVKVTELNGKYQFIFDQDVQSGLYVISYRSAGRTFSQQFVLSF